MKIHSSPGAGDLAAVVEYRENLATDTPAEIREWVEDLETDLRQMYSTGLDGDSWERLAVAGGDELGRSFRSASAILGDATT